MSDQAADVESTVDVERFSGVSEPLRRAMGGVAALNAAAVVEASRHVDELAVRIASLQSQHTAAKAVLERGVGERSEVMLAARLALVETQDAEDNMQDDAPARQILWEAAVALADNGVGPDKPGRSEARLAEALKISAECFVDTPIVVVHPSTTGTKPSFFEGHRATAVPRIGLSSRGHETTIAIECSDRRLEQSLAKIVKPASGSDVWVPAHNLVIGRDAITRLANTTLAEASVGQHRVPAEVINIAKAVQKAGLHLSDIALADLVRRYETVALQDVADPSPHGDSEGDWGFVLSYRAMDQAAVDNLYERIAQRLADRVAAQKTWWDRRTNAAVTRPELEAKVRRIMSALPGAPAADSAVEHRVSSIAARAKTIAASRRG